MRLVLSTAKRFLKHVTEALNVNKKVEPLLLQELQRLEYGFEATHFHTQVSRKYRPVEYTISFQAATGQFQIIWARFRFEIGRLFFSSRVKAYGVDLDEFQ